MEGIVTQISSRNSLQAIQKVRKEADSVCILFGRKSMRKSRNTTQWFSNGSATKDKEQKNARAVRGQHRKLNSYPFGNGKGSFHCLKSLSLSLSPSLSLHKQTDAPKFTAGASKLAASERKELTAFRLDSALGCQP